MSDTREGRSYPARPLVGIGVVLLRGQDVLLVRRGRPPAIGEWSLPGGGQRLGETAEAAARRELREETGLDVGPLQLVGHADSIHHDEDGRIRFHYTILDFGGLWIGGEPVAGGDVTDARFTPVADLAGMGIWAPARRIVALAVAALAVAAPGDQISG